MQYLKDRPYLKVDEPREGMRIEIDGDFTCAQAGEYTLQKHEENDLLYFPCKHGKHFIDGQLSDDGKFYMGIYNVG